MNFATKYKEVKPGTSLRTVARSAALDVLSLLSFERQAILSKPRIQFIYLHHVFTDEEKALRKLLAHLSKTYTFIGYSDAIDRLTHNKIDKPYINFSTDDGFKNNLKAAEILNEFGVKACFFVCPDIIGQSNGEVIKNFCNQRLHLPPVEFLNWDDISQLQKQGHEIGSHTMSHAKLTETPDAINEIAQSKYVLEKRVGPVKHFAYPYGRYFHINRQLFYAVFESGYVSCASAERGCHINGHNSEAKPLIRRDQVILDWKLSHIQYFLNHNAGNKQMQHSLPPF